ncbi:MAG: S8 family serine peptidase [Rubrivivax sp.]|nr:S8 family serine peptidase [Rubrivivax sp.]
MKSSDIPLGCTFDLPRLLWSIPFDPWQLWAAMSRWAEFGASAPATVSVAMELVNGAKGHQLIEALDKAGSGLSRADVQMPPVYDKQRYVTAQVSQRFLETWYESQPIRNLVTRIELGMPVVGVRSAFGTPRTYTALRPDLPLIGVIDHGFAFASPDFTRKALPGDSRTSRVVTLWDQDAEHPALGGLPHAKPPSAFGFGMEVTGAEIDALLSSKTESACYEAAGYAELRRRSMHGTHVTSLAAGPLRPSHRLHFGRLGTPVPVPVPEVAPDVGLALVQLPRAAVQDSSGRWLAVHMLDALHHIVAAAAPGQRVVVNISYGSRVGPHDGTGILERAMVDLLLQFNANPAAHRLDIVLAAGNAFDTRSHAVLPLPAEGQTLLHWQVAAGSEVTTFTELWIPDGVDPRDVEVRLVPPRATGMPPIQARGGQIASSVDAQQRLIASIQFPVTTSLGQNGTCALISVAPTLPRSPDVRAPAGRWAIELRLHGASVAKAAGREVHAYLARNDADFGQPRRGRPSHFVAGAAYDQGNRHLRKAPDDAHPPASAVQRLGTLAWNVQASGLHVVAGYVNRPYADKSSAHAVRVHAPYSSAGPSRDEIRLGPDVNMPSDASPVSRGVRGSGTRGNSTVTLVGTSATAPQWVRVLVNPPKPNASLPIPAPPPALPVRDTPFFGGTLQPPP